MRAFSVPLDAFFLRASSPGAKGPGPMSAPSDLSKAVDPLETRFIRSFAASQPHGFEILGPLDFVDIAERVTHSERPLREHLALG